MELTKDLLEQLYVTTSDTVIELAPGLRHTAKMMLSCRPPSYLGVDSEFAIIADLNRRLGRDGVRFVQGSADDTGLPGETASVLFGKTIFSMQSPARQHLIVKEAWRIVRCGGRFGIHERGVCDTVPEAYRRKMEAGLATAIRHDVHLLAAAEWRELLESAGFRVAFQRIAPMALLDDVLVLEMRRTLHRYRDKLQAVAMVCQKEY